MPQSPQLAPLILLPLALLLFSHQTPTLHPLIHNMLHKKYVYNSPLIGANLV